MKKYILLSALSATMLMTGCTKDTYDTDEKKPGASSTIAVGFTSPGIAEAVAWTPDEEATWTSAKIQSALPALADTLASDAPVTGIGEDLVLQLKAGSTDVPAVSDSLPLKAAPATRTALPANTTVRVVAYTTASGNPLKANYVAEQTYYMNDGNLEPCTVNVDGSFLAAAPDAGLLLESGNYDFYAISPALPLNADKTTLSVANGVDYASSVTTNVAAAETVALTQMERKCVRLQLTVKKAGPGSVETLSVKNAQLSALSDARTVTIGSDIPAGTGNTAFAPVFTNPVIDVAEATTYLLPVSGLTLNTSYTLTVKHVGENAKELTLKSSLPNLTLEKGKSYTLDATVREIVQIGDLVLSPIGIVSAAGATVTVKSPFCLTGFTWTASLMNPFAGVSLGAVSGSGSGCSAPVTFAVNPNNSERSTTLMASAPWADTPRTLTMTQAGSTMGTLSQSPGNNITASGATVTVTTPGATPGLPWAATLSNTSGFTLGTVSGSGNTGSVPVTVAVNPTNTVRSTVLTAKAKDGNTSGTVTITQAAASLTYNSPSETTPVAYTERSVKFTLTGTTGLRIKVEKISGPFTFGSPVTPTFYDATMDFELFMAENSTKDELYSDCKVTVVNDGANGSLDLTVRVKQKPNPRAVGYITKAGDETGLPAGLYCIGMYGDHNGSSYTKALYIDKRGANGSGVNPGNANDYKSTVQKGGYNGQYGAANPNPSYCSGKGMYLPAIDQLSAMYKASLSGEYSFVSDGYWSSTITGLSGYTAQRYVNFSNGSVLGGNHVGGSGSANTYYMRCVREW